MGRLESGETRIDAISDQLREATAENERLRGAIQSHREAHGGLEMPGPHELRAANRRLWATIETK